MGGDDLIRLAKPSLASNPDSTLSKIKLLAWTLLGLGMRQMLAHV